MVLRFKLIHGPRTGHKLPIKAELRARIAKEEGETVTVRLTERLGTLLAGG